MPLPQNALQYRLAHRTPFFYGWVIVFSAGAAVFVRNAAASLTLAVFMVPMSEDLGWPRTLIAGAASVGGIAAMFASPLTGYFVDRYGPRIVLGGAAAVLGGSTMLIGWATVPIAFYVLFAIGRVIFSSPMQIGAWTVVSQWFVERRGRATGILGVAHSFGMGLLPLFAQVLINTVGWQEAWFWLGVAVWVVALVPIFLLMVTRPEDVGMTPDRRTEPGESAGQGTGGEREPQVEWTLRQAMRAPALWGFGLAGGMLFFIHSSVNIHQAAFLQDQGISPTVSAAALTVLAGGTAVGSIFWGWVLDRMRVRLTYAGVALWLAAVSLLFLAVDRASLAFAVAGVFGVGLGGLLVVPPVVFADHFGRRALGSIRGVTEPFVGGGQALGAFGAGLIFDLTGGYDLVFPTLTVMALLGGLIIILVPSPGSPTDEATAPAAEDTP